MENNKIEYMKYSNAFVCGYRDNVYCDAINVLSEDSVDYSNMESIGYYDGSCYAEYIVNTFQTMSVTSEQLMAEIDKRYTNALKKCNELENETSKGLR